MPGISNFERVCGQNTEIARQLKAELSKGQKLQKLPNQKASAHNENSSHDLIQNSDSTTEIKNESSVEEIRIKLNNTESQREEDSSNKSYNQPEKST